MNYQNGNVNICVGCCKINRENRKTLPLMCPRTDMPCFAIVPDYIIPQISEELVYYLDGFNQDANNNIYDLRLPIDCKYIDQQYVQTRIDAFDELAKLGNKTIYTLPAY